MAGTFAEATVIEGLPVPVAAIDLPPPPVRSCFPELESRKLNRLRLISPRARMCASEATRPSSQCAGRCRSGWCATRWNFVPFGEGSALGTTERPACFRGGDHDRVAASQQITSAQIHTVHSPGCAGSRLPGEGRDPCVAWAPAFAGVAETLMSVLLCSCRVNLLNGSEH
jgi:hypothetical protein